MVVAITYSQLHDLVKALGPSRPIVTVQLFEMHGSGHGGLSKNRKRRACGKDSAEKG